MGYSLRVNHKKLADQQFRHITALRERCAADHSPLISVDTKKKELVAGSAIPAPSGTAAPNWSTTTTSAPTPTASPCPTASTTPAPMPARLRRPNRRHPGVRRRLHRGGAPRAASAIPKPRPCRSWPTAAAATAARRAPGSSTCNIDCNRHGLRVRVAHCPPRRPHRTPPVLRDQQELGRRSRFETILKYLRTTRTSTGLRVRRTSCGKPTTGVKVTDAQMRELRITPNSAMPK